MKHRSAQILLVRKEAGGSAAFSWVAPTKGKRLRMDSGAVAEVTVEQPGIAPGTWNSLRPGEAALPCGRP